MKQKIEVRERERERGAKKAMKLFAPKVVAGALKLDLSPSRGQLARNAYKNGKRRKGDERVGAL